MQFPGISRRNSESLLKNLLPAGVVAAALLVQRMQIRTSAGSALPVGTQVMRWRPRGKENQIAVWLAPIKRSLTNQAQGLFVLPAIFRVTEDRSARYVPGLGLRMRGVVFCRPA